MTLLRAFAGDRAPTATAYRETMLVGAALCLVAAVVGWVVPGLPGGPPPSAAEDSVAVERGEVAAAGLPFLEE